MKEETKKERDGGRGEEEKKERRGKERKKEKKEREQGIDFYAN